MYKNVDDLLSTLNFMHKMSAGIKFLYGSVELINNMFLKALY